MKQGKPALRRTGDLLSPFGVKYINSISYPCVVQPHGTGNVKGVGWEWVKVGAQKNWRCHVHGGAREELNTGALGLCHVVAAMSGLRASNRFYSLVRVRSSESMSGGSSSSKNGVIFGFYLSPENVIAPVSLINSVSAAK